MTILTGEGSLGVLPLGTLNHFARDLAIPTELEEAAKLIAGRKQRRVDVAEMNERIFINNSAIGLYPLMVIDRDVQRCQTVTNATPEFWDVTYNYRGIEHRIQMSAPPGPTLVVNERGEPRQ